MTTTLVRPKPQSRTVRERFPNGGDQVLVHMNEAQLRLVDTYRGMFAVVGENISRPEAVRRLMSLAVSKLSTLPAHEVYQMLKESIPPTPKFP